MRLCPLVRVDFVGEISEHASNLYLNHFGGQAELLEHVTNNVFRQPRFLESMKAGERHRNPTGSEPNTLQYSCRDSVELRQIGRLCHFRAPLDDLFASAASAAVSAVSHRF